MMMLPRKNRLIKKADFDRVYRKKKVSGGRDFVVFFVPNSGRPSRFGFVVSHHFGKAVLRNRIKRLCREAIRHNMAHIVPGYDIIIQIKKQRYDKSMWEVEKDLIYLLFRARLLEPGHANQGSARLVLPTA